MRPQDQAAPASHQAMSQPPLKASLNEVFGLFVLVGICLATCGFSLTSWSPFVPYPFILIGSIGISFWMLKQPHQQKTSWAILFVLSILLAFTILTAGSLSSASFYLIPLLSAVAAFALGLKGSFFVGVLGSVLSTSLYFTTPSNQLTKGVSSPTEFWLIQVGVFLCISLLIGEGVRRLNTALDLSRNNERIAKEALNAHNLEIQKRLQAETALRKSVAQAEAASEAKSKFLANMSHELRTPLNAILGYAEMLQEDHQQEEDTVADLKRIHSSGKHLLTLINDILDLSKIEAGQMKLCREWFDVSSLINDLAGLVFPIMDQHNNMLVLDLDQDIGMVHNDPLRVQQILLNLLSNAAKFTEDGTIILCVHRAKIDGQEVIQFSVKDTGIGISEQQLSQLFRPFAQADKKTFQKYGGTGLGLVLSARFAEMMEGSIQTESVLSEGSTFTLTLPIHTASSHIELLHKERLANISNNTQPIVLCLDDEPATLDIITRGVDHANCYAIPLQNPNDLLPLALQLQPQAITLDLNMPGIDGWMLLDELKANPNTAKIPIIIISVEDEAVKAITRGAADYLVKPIERQQLQELLHEYTQTKKPTHTPTEPNPLYQPHIPV